MLVPQVLQAMSSSMITPQNPHAFPNTLGRVGQMPLLWWQGRPEGRVWKQGSQLEVGRLGQSGGVGEGSTYGIQ